MYILSTIWKVLPMVIFHTSVIDGKYRENISCLPGRPRRCVGRGHRVLGAGSGDTYRVERVYLDGGQAYGFAQYSGIAPVEPVQVEEWEAGDPPGPL